MKQPLISIVVTVHNSERTLVRCLDSIISQPKHDMIELLCVNDHSNDRSELIVKKRQLPWINVNGNGVGAARNTGITVAHGQYIWFVDSDDELIASSIDQYLVDILQQTSVDLVVIGVAKHFNSKTVIVKNNKLRTYPVQFSLNSSKFPIFKQNILNSSWNKIYNLNFIKQSGVRYPQFTTGEDAIFNYQLFLSAKSLMTVPRVAYQFNVFSTTSSKFYWKKDQLLASRKMVELIIKLMKRTTLVDHELLYMALIDILIAAECNLLYRQKKTNFAEFNAQLKKADFMYLRQQCQRYKTTISKNYLLKAWVAQNPLGAYWYIRFRFLKD